MKVVSLSFRCAKKLQTWIGVGSPLCCLEAIGEVNNLNDIAQSLFKYYLDAIDGEAAVYGGIWRFCPFNEEKLMLDPATPILSGEIKLATAENQRPQSFSRFYLKRGDNLLFSYNDEARAIRLIATIERIFEQPCPTSSHCDDNGLPRPANQLPFMTSSRSDQAPATVDAVFPRLSTVAMSNQYAGCLFGSSGTELHGAVEAGPTHNGDQIYAPLPFQDLEDYLICTENAWTLIDDEESKGVVPKGWVNVFVIPPESQPKEDELKLEKLQQLLARNSARQRRRGGGGCGDNDGSAAAGNGDEDNELTSGSRILVSRMSVDEMSQKRSELRGKGFDLAKLFPTLCNTLAKPHNVDNLWFKIYQRRVMVAMGMTKLKDERKPVHIIGESKLRFMAMQDAFAEAETILLAHHEATAAAAAAEVHTRLATKRKREERL